MTKNKMFTNSKGISYYQRKGKYFKNSGWLEKEITKEEFEREIQL